MEKKCHECKKYEEELNETDIASFLHKHIQDTHLADILLDFIVRHKRGGTLLFENFNLLDVGNTIQLSGAIWSGKGKNYFCYFPNEYDSKNEDVSLIMALDDWKEFIRQSDLKEVEILSESENGDLAKAIARKSNRQIDQRIMWSVFKRDKYHCRYCGKTGIPLTVDHLVLWEEGGATIEDNLLTSCRKCNKTRGNMQYRDWLNSPYYQKISKKLPMQIKQANFNILQRLDTIPRVTHKRSR